MRRLKSFERVEYYRNGAWHGGYIFLGYDGDDAVVRLAAPEFGLYTEYVPRKEDHRLYHTSAICVRLPTYSAKLCSTLTSIFDEEHLTLVLFPVVGVVAAIVHARGRLKEKMTELYGEKVAAALCVRTEQAILKMRQFEAEYYCAQHCPDSVVITTDDPNAPPS